MTKNIRVGILGAAVVLLLLVAGFAGGGMMGGGMMGGGMMGGMLVMLLLWAIVIALLVTLFTVLLTRQPAPRNDL